MAARSAAGTGTRAEDTGQDGTPADRNLGMPRQCPTPINQTVLGQPSQTTEISAVLTRYLAVTSFPLEPIPQLPNESLRPEVSR